MGIFDRWAKEAAAADNAEVFTELLQQEQQRGDYTPEQQQAMRDTLAALHREQP